MEDADLEVAEAAICGGEMLENLWQTAFSAHAATGPCRGGDGLLLVCHQRHEERGNC